MKRYCQLWDAIFREAEGVGAGGAPSGGGAPNPGAASGGKPAGEGGGGNGEGNDSSGSPGLVQLAAGNGEPGKTGGEGAAAGGASDPGGAPAAYWPEGLPDTLNELKGANDRETIEKLTGHLKDAPRAPEKPDGYTVALPEEFTKRFGDLSDDDVMPIWRQVAHKNGLTDAQFNGAISELYTELSERGLIDEPINPQSELEKLMPKHGDAASRTAQASARINGVASTIDGLVTRKWLTKTEGNIVLALAARADGVVALEKLFKAAGQNGLQGGGTADPHNGLSQHERQMRSMFPSMNQGK